VTDCFAGRLADSPYLVEYERPIIPWRMALGRVDGETVVVIMRDDADGSTPFSVIRLEVVGERIVGITDYIKSSWVLEAADSVVVEGARKPGPALRTPCRRARISQRSANVMGAQLSSKPFRRSK